MVLLRSVGYFAALVVSTLLFALPIILLGWILPFRSISLIANTWGSTNLSLLSAICGLRYRVEGLENLPQGGCIVCAKHQSSWETIALRGLLPPNQTWVLKRELLWVPVFGWALFFAQSIAIDRKAGRAAVKQVVEQGIRHLQRGRMVVVFPEGTRVAPGERKKYGVGGALLAEKSGYPVVPIAHNAGVFWRRRDLRKYPGTIDVRIGPLIDPNGLTAAAINRKVEDWIESNVASLPQSGPAPRAG